MVVTQGYTQRTWSIPNNDIDKPVGSARSNRFHLESLDPGCACSPRRHMATSSPFTLKPHLTRGDHQFNSANWIACDVGQFEHEE